MRILLLVISAVLSGQQPPAPVPAPAPAPAPAAVAPELSAPEKVAGFARMGFDIGAQSPLPQIRTEYEMSPEEVDAFVSGLRLAMLGQVPAGAALDSRFDAMLKVRAGARAARAKQANVDFLAKIDADKGVTKTASGLRYKVIKAGDATKPSAKSSVSCLYHGTLADGTVFDSTRNRGNQPVSFGLGEVIPGWTEGLQLIGKGGVIKLWIPAALAYGEQDSGPIPGGSVLEFEVELLDVK